MANINPMKQFTLILIILLGFNVCFGQDSTTLYHLYQPTSSMSKIEKWNIHDTTNQRYLVREKIDNKNRVTSIQFLVDGKIENRNPMYGIDNITFEYGENFIIERYLNYKGEPMTFLDDETPTSRKYFLDENNNIIDCKTIYEITFDELTKEKLLELENSLRFWRENVISETDSGDNKDCDMDYIYGYMFSEIKMDGIFPTKRDYKFDYDSFDMIYSKEILDEMKNKY